MLRRDNGFLSCLNKMGVPESRLAFRPPPPTKKKNERKKIISLSADSFTFYLEKVDAIYKL